jgi:O-antigen ligase
VGAYAFGRDDALERWWLPLAVVGVAGLGVLAVIKPTIALALAIALVFVGVTIVDFVWGVALFIVLTFLETLPMLGSGLSALKAGGAVLALSWLVAASRRGHSIPLLVRSHQRLAGAAVALTAWNFCSVLWATDRGTAISTSFRLLQGVFLLFIVFSAVERPRDLRLLLSAYIAGAALTAVVGLSGATAQDSASYGTTARLSGGIGDPNELAAILLPALVVGAFSLTVLRGLLARLLLAGSVLLFLVALLLTQSRGAIVGVGVVFAAALIFAGPVRGRAIAVMLVIAGLGVLYYVLIAPPEALSRITQFSAGGGTGRTDLWAVAVRMFTDHPLIGVGSGNFPVVEPVYALANLDITRIDFVVDRPHIAHNTYLQSLSETGVIGGIGLLLVFVTALAIAWRAARSLAGTRLLSLEVTTRGLIVGTIGTFAAFSFISALYDKQLWVLLGLLAGSATLARPTPT